ncbi:MAG: FCD domain-containing protein [Paracoccaceae bacterium]|nr:FCD domain-containing protein [Paracoccaceae bacterium]
MTPPTIDNSNLALERLRGLVADLAGRADSKLPTERALAESWGISRRAIRRALEVLEAEGQVWRRQGAGTFAGPRPLAAPVPNHAALMPSADFAEVMEVRLRIEPQLAQLAALRARPDCIARMHEVMARLDAADDADSRELWDSALHREIARSAGNQFFLMVFDAMDRARHDQAWRNIRDRARNSDLLQMYHQQHRAIVEATAAHDPVRAGEAMLTHLRTLNDNLLRQTSLEGLADVS